MYLLDADTLIKAEDIYYSKERFPIFWEWLHFQATSGLVKTPLAQYDEVTAGTGEIVRWLKSDEIASSLILDEDIDDAMVQDTIANGYADDLNDIELPKLGRDPILISHARASKGRTVVSFETSAPSKQRQNRKVPDVCKDFDIICIDLFGLIRALDFKISWTRP